jgi:hypothetical protein
LRSQTHSFRCVSSRLVPCRPMPHFSVPSPDPDNNTTMRRFPCSAVQRLVNTRNVYHRVDTCQYIFHYTYATCRCTTPSGDLLSDILVPTLSPANGGAPATRGYVGNKPSSTAGSGSTNGTNTTAGAAGGSSSAMSHRCISSLVFGALVTLLVTVV